MQPDATPPGPARTTREELPARRIGDQERERAAVVLQRACGEGRLTLEEFTERVGAVWAATTAEQLDRLTADLAPVLAGATTARSRTVVNVLGDGRRAGRWRVSRRLRLFNLLGDWELDLRGALLSPDAVADGIIDITHVSLLGDLRIIVPEGVDAELGGFGLLGDRKVELAPVPLRPGTPSIRIRSFGLLGDVTIRSMP